MMFKFQPKGGDFNNFQDLIDNGYIKLQSKALLMESIIVGLVRVLLKNNTLK